MLSEALIDVFLNFFFCTFVILTTNQLLPKIINRCIDSDGDFHLPPCERWAMLSQCGMLASVSIFLTTC